MRVLFRLLKASLGRSQFAAGNYGALSPTTVSRTWFPAWGNQMGLSMSNVMGNRMVSDWNSIQSYSEPYRPGSSRVTPRASAVGY